MALLRAIVWAVLFVAGTAHAAPADSYHAALRLAAQGQDAQAVQRLREGLNGADANDPWRLRMAAAASLIEARGQTSTAIDLSKAPMQQAMSEAYLKTSPPAEAASWPAGLLSLLLPGSGHAWMGRWRDAGVAATMVWPMIGLTLWAARRRMGPVTVFFAMITIWLWSGVIFSALSIAEREAAEIYMQWWQGLWGATGLPGRPW